MLFPGWFFGDDFEERSGCHEEGPVGSVGAVAAASVAAEPAVTEVLGCPHVVARVWVGVVVDAGDEFHAVAGLRVRAPWWPDSTRAAPFACDSWDLRWTAVSPAPGAPVSLVMRVGVAGRSMCIRISCFARWTEFEGKIFPEFREPGGPSGKFGRSGKGRGVPSPETQRGPCGAIVRQMVRIRSGNCSRNSRGGLAAPGGQNPYKRCYYGAGGPPSLMGLDRGARAPSPPWFWGGPVGGRGGWRRGADESGGPSAGGAVLVGFVDGEGRGGAGRAAARAFTCIEG